MDTISASIFIGCKYFRSRTKVNTGQFNGAELHICHCFLCNYCLASVAKLSIRKMHEAMLGLFFSEQKQRVRGGLCVFLYV